MTTLDSLESDLLELARKLKQQGKPNDEIEKELLSYLLEKRKSQSFSIPELEALAKKRKQILEKLDSSVKAIITASRAATGR